MDTAALANAAIQIAAAGANQYLRAHNLTADQSALAECLRSWVRAKLPEALADAKEAFDLHMDAVGVQTFQASIMQAGIEAAKEASTARRSNSSPLAW
jgi:hypothetical protein